ncbi:mitochondrial Mn-superoxide dismutase [Rhizophagus irregularis]|uniref:Superoxide dismutase n=4 Tax=Rhizophagus irregularis TaxID=588596 RepID=A0A2I1E3J7_9GLOM|nr:mitochondrial Mn-superoxide dismutase [Rhizophagus irregularis DAOM 181602=DAOM 197198]EXX73464.1 superoxide dismutase SOD2 [Rhizophagus irregularis DAOM 197198w]PKC13273.1 mitochondrial Mn-superoxide dismutase [Rhizophagus irregularis]PKC76438.1 mitochondrial Mn-superoxide dismutase [Rhizophagus irregularis]PKY16700.1 mitochondrial Mn-superoxide dismutase [Rhizophagus irregularis]POG61855.1 mitochondrial Mn-superoxide dismutase [Rhizophagus irregularis DAOM 181602=DAOM 197198]|eukprot:XP_025168721.1 mitochondrial Mn-superoxide dismutase [Rhizophagus irregularis DAOM 181602=DAOM 197198]
MLRLAFPARAVQNIYTSTLARSSTSFTVKRSKYTLPDLPYDYNALEPIISADIMKVHHEKHHQAYVNGLNVAEEKFEQALKDKDVISQIALQPALKFNGGGHINHSLFWANLAPKKEGGGEPPNGELLSAIKKEFDSLENFISKFNTLTAAVQGSGWGWLGYNKTTKRVEIVTLPNQDPLTTHVPLLGIDVWEHAYYLQYKNARPDYLKAVWEVVNWKTVAARFENAK